MPTRGKDVSLTNLRAELFRQIRYILPLHGVLLLTEILPDNRLSIRLRGWLASPFLGSVGAGFCLGRDVTVLSPWRFTAGHNCYLAKGAWVNAAAGFRLGNEVTLGPYVVASTVQKVPNSSGSFFGGGSVSGPINVGDGTWIGAAASLIAGCSVPASSLVGANSVFSGRHAEPGLYAGSPANRRGPVTLREPEGFTKAHFDTTPGA